MQDHLRILQLAARGALPETVDERSDLPVAVVRELVEAGYLVAMDASSHDGIAFLEPRITLAGREYLGELGSEHETTLDSDAARVLRVLVENATPPRSGERDHRGYPLLTAGELATLSQLPQDRLEAAVARLGDLDYAGPDYATPESPYRFGTVLLNPSDRAAHEGFSLPKPAGRASLTQPGSPPSSATTVPASNSSWDRYGRPTVVGIIVTVIGGLLLALLL